VAGLDAVEALVQVGLRDLAPDELAAIQANEKIRAFTDGELRRGSARGIAWVEQCKRILEALGPDVYLSLDVDGLDPKYCPSTGTPVPGGLELWELYTLLEELRSSGRKLIGFDLVEVAPGKDEWDANVGARLLFQICQFL
jgi:agmatinase